MRTNAGGGYTGAARHTTEDAFMIPGMGAQPVPVKEWVAANDNVPTARVISTTGGQYIGLTRNGDPNGCADDLVTTTLAPLEDVVADAKREYRKFVDNIWRDEPRGGHVVPPRPSSADTGRHGSFMQTYTGRKFFPMDPRANEVCIRDIAHSLSLQCRYAGHCRRFLSVAEHSVHIARWLVGVAPGDALWGLLHDASEAYLIDVPRPVKPFLTGYKAAESNVMAAVCARFGLPLEMPAAVHEADERIIADELVNLVPMAWHARHDDPLGVTLRYWSPAEAEEEFLETFKALSVEVW